MTKSLTNPLAQYISKNGIAIIGDKNRFESLIRDLYNKDERNRNLLIRSLELKIPQEILSNQKIPEFNLSLKKIVVNLCDAHGLEKKNAEWVVETWTEALSPKEISIDLGNGIRLELVLIPAGSFKVEFFTTKTGQRDFKDQCGITLKKSFYMCKFAITQEQWKTYSKENISKFIGDNLPITNISWHDSLKFIQKLNAITDGGFRLPIRAEWEYACRAGSTSLYSFGDQITPNDANYCESKIEKPIPVGSYKPNQFGLFEMHGNVDELCVSCRGDENNTYSLEVPQFKFEDGELIHSDNICVSTHGGSYQLEAEAAKSNHSWDASQHYFRHDDVGFRLVKDNHFSLSNTSQNKESSKPPIQNDTFSNLIQASMLAEENANRLAKETAKWLAEENANRLSEENAKWLAEKNAKRLAAENANRLAKENAKKLEEEEAKKLEEEEAKKLEEEEANRLAKETAKRLAEDNANRLAEENTKKINKNYAIEYYESGIRSALRKDFQATINHFTRALELDPTFSEAYISLGNTYGELKDYDEAVYNYTLANICDPENVGVLNSRGIAYYRLKRYSEAIADYTSAIDINPSEADIFYNRGLSHGAQGKYDFALDDYIQALRLNPSHEKARIYLKKAYEKLKDMPSFDITKKKLVKSFVITNKYKSLIYFSVWIIAFFLGIGLIPNLFYSTETSIEKAMVLIPSGEFSMGSHASEYGRSKDETMHKVTLTKPFYICKYEVTQEQYQGVMGNNPSSTKAASLPVTNVSWEDCQDFIKKFNARTGGGYRLPTEAEWEYACKARGDVGLNPEHANCSESNIGKPVAVGSYKPNYFGLYDMHGNVWEWCEDWYGAYALGLKTDPKGPATGARRVLRGGSFGNVQSRARASCRDYLAPADRFSFVGFRLARTVVSDEANKANKELAKSLQKKEEVKVKQDRNSKFLFIKKEMVLIQPDKFKMGSPASEYNRSNDEIQHEVSLSKPFLIGRFEVTQEDWTQVMGCSPSRDTGANLPVTNISWEDCHEFINVLNAESHWGYRLPTEAEWEYACRAGANTSYSFGEYLKKNALNYQGGNIKKVGSYNPNAFGLYDMHGNVWEWCEDWYGEYPVGAVTDPKGPATGLARVLRGGSFLSVESAIYSSSRSKNLPTSKGIAIGFRLARTP